VAGDAGGKVRMFWQGRVFAASPDEAAMKIRDKWRVEGRLTVLECEPKLGWYEYCIQVGCGKEGGPDGVDAV